MFVGATLVTAAEGIASSDNDTSIPTTATVIDALDAKQPLDADLTTLAGLTATTNNFIVAVSSAWASRTPAQVRTTLNVADGATANSSDATLLARANHTGTQALSTIAASTSTALGVGSLELGHATDTTLARGAAGDLTVEGVSVLTTGNTKTVTAKTMDTASNTFTGFTWAPEGILTGTTIATGYGDMPGGFSVEPGPNANGVYLDSIWVRVSDGTNNSGGDLVIDVYEGTATTLQSALIASVTLTNGSNNVISTLGSPYSLAANAVVRAYITKGSSTLAKAVHMQLRGRYKG
jgi:hypothetical protein